LDFLHGLGEVNRDIRERERMRVGRTRTSTKEKTPKQELKKALVSQRRAPNLARDE
jgi:hypothetical protein